MNKFDNRQFLSKRPSVFGGIFSDVSMQFNVIIYLIFSICRCVTWSALAYYKMSWLGLSLHCTWSLSALIRRILTFRCSFSMSLNALNYFSLSPLCLAPSHPVVVFDVQHGDETNLGKTTTRVCGAKRVSTGNSWGVVLVEL